MTGARSGRLARQRIALTIARRTSVRSLGRSALIAALIAVPIAGLSGLVVVGETMQPTTVETVATQLGHSEAMLRVVSPPTRRLFQNAITPSYFDITGSGAAADRTVMVESSSVLPIGTRIVEIYAASATVQTATGIATLRTLEGEPCNPSLAGHFDLVAGHRPTADDQIMVSPARPSRSTPDRNSEGSPSWRVSAAVGRSCSRFSRRPE